MLTARGWFFCISAVAFGAGCGARASSSHESGGMGGESASSGGESASSGGESAGSGGERAGSGGSSAHAAGSGGSSAHAAGSGGSSAHAAGSGAVAGSSSTSGGGAPSQAGAPSTGGTGASGAGGTSTTGHGSPASVNAACSELCEEFNRCPDGKGSIGSCDRCFSVVYMGNDATCTAKGEEMIACLTAADRADLPACGDAFSLAVQKCAEKVAAYQACASVDTGRYFCVQVSRDPAQAHSCTEERKCLNGDFYSITCSDTSSGESSCSCQAPGETRSFTVGDATPDACIYHQCISP